VLAAMQDMQTNPANMSKHMGDPEVMSLMMKIQNLMGS